MTDLPPTCEDCGEKWRKTEESSEFHEVYEPVCNCYKEEIRLSVG